MAVGHPGCGGSRDPVELLLGKKLVSPQAARQAREASKDPIGWLLAEGHISDRDAAWARASAKGVLFADLDRAMILFETYHLPAGKAWELGALPIKSDSGRLYVAFRDPEDRRAIREVERLTGYLITPFAVPPSQLDWFLNQLYFEPDLSIGDPLPREAGEYLIKKGYISRAQLEAAKGNDPLEELLRADAIGEREFAMAKAWESELAFYGGSRDRLDVESYRSFPPELTRETGILPLRKGMTGFKVAVRDPKNYGAFLRAEFRSGCRIIPCFVMPLSEILAAIEG